MFFEDRAMHQCNTAIATKQCHALFACIHPGSKSIGERHFSKKYTIAILAFLYMGAIRALPTFESADSIIS